MFLETLNKLYVSTRQFLQREDGASGIEYAIVAALVAVVIIGFGTGIGDGITDIFDKIVDGLKTGS